MLDQVVQIVAILAIAVVILGIQVVVITRRLNRIHANFDRIEACLHHMDDWADRLGTLANVNVGRIKALLGGRLPFPHSRSAMYLFGRRSHDGSSVSASWGTGGAASAGGAVGHACLPFVTARAARPPKLLA